MYICVEGVDGCGKNVQADLLCQYFRDQGLDPLQVHEPDEGLPGGAELRRLLQMGADQEAYPGLFLANRMVLQAVKVVPALAAEQPVVSVRSFISSLVYQQQDQWPLPWLLDIHRMLPVKPTHIVIIDIEPEEAAERLNRRNTAKEHYEQIDIQRRNRARYLDLASSGVLQSFVAPGGVVSVVSGNGTVQETHEQISNLFSRSV